MVSDVLEVPEKNEAVNRDKLINIQIADVSRRGSAHDASWMRHSRHQTPVEPTRCFTPIIIKFIFAPNIFDISRVKSYCKLLSVLSELKTES